jgi:hypothetical protein
MTCINCNIRPKQMANECARCYTFRQKRGFRWNPSLLKRRENGYWVLMGREVLAGNITGFKADRTRKNENSLRKAMKSLGYAPVIRNYGRTFEVQGWRKRAQQEQK